MIYYYQIDCTEDKVKAVIKKVLTGILNIQVVRITWVNLGKLLVMINEPDFEGRNYSDIAAELELCVWRECEKFLDIIVINTRVEAGA